MRTTAQSDLQAGATRATAPPALEVHYEPICELDTGTIVGAEALLRRRMPSGVVQIAARFLPLAEATGLLVEIGRRVIDKACAEAATWQAFRRNASVTVNISSRQLEDPALPGWIEAVLARHALRADLLILDIPEVVIAHAALDGGPHLQHLREISELGVRIAVDDVGTGPGAPSYLPHVPASILKIDGRYVRNVDETQENGLVPAIIALAREHGLTTLAEGIERPGLAIEGLIAQGGRSHRGVWLQTFGQPLALAVLEGWRLPVGNSEKLLRSFITLRSCPGSLGDGRNLLVETETGTELIGLAKFADGSQGIAAFATDSRFQSPTPSGGSFELRVATTNVGEPAGAVANLPGAEFSKFGLPASTIDGASLAFAGKLTRGRGGVATTTDRGVFVQHGGGAPVALARIGDQADGLPGVKLRALSDPVISGDGVVFRAALTGNGIHAGNDTSLWGASPNEAPVLLAQEGSQAADALEGVRWKNFTSFAVADLPDDLLRVLFTANLIRGSGGVNASNDEGLWGVDSTGTLRLLIQKGQLVDGLPVLKFEVLNATVLGSRMTHSYNHRGELLWRATFASGATAIVRSEIQ